MKTRKALVALVLAAFSLSIAAAAFAQSGTSGTVQVTPAKPAPKKGTVTTTIKPVAVSPKPAGAASATATTAKPATAKAAAGEKKATGEKKSEAPGGVVGARTIVGEVVDPGCWIVNGSKGASHKECAIACAKAGQVLGILENKTQKLYILATDKPGEDPNKGLIDYVGQIVTAKGRVYSRGGATGIKITSVEPYSAMPAAQ
jgi:hypothetical protein